MFTFCLTFSGSSYEAEQEAEERKKQMEQDKEFIDNYMNEDDIFDGLGRQR